MGRYVQNGTRPALRDIEGTLSLYVISALCMCMLIVGYRNWAFVSVLFVGV